MKKLLFALLITSVFALSSCGGNTQQTTQNSPQPVESSAPVDLTAKLEIIDSLGNIVTFDEQPKNVVTLGSSVTEIWLLSGGTVVGTSSDSFDREIGLNDGAENIGTYKEPNVEQILKLNPDMIVMSSDISGQRDVEQTFRDAGITVVFADVNSFEDYLHVLENFTILNNTPELFVQHGSMVLDQIDENIKNAEKMEPKTGLVLRTSTAVLKTLPSDNFSVEIIEDMGIKNIASDNDAILNDINIEAILKEDPYYIFLVIMGSDEEKSMAKINEYIANNPSWNTLTAVKEGRFITLPKELFHYKPNNRWGEAYEYIYNIRTENE